MVLIIITLSALCVLTTYMLIRTQKSLNTRFATPIIHIGQNDQETELAVTIRNCGPGLAIIQNLTFSNAATQEVKQHLDSWLPDVLPAKIGCSKYKNIYSDFVMQSGEVINLVKIAIDTDKLEQVFVREVLRSLFSSLTIKFEYRDIFNNTFPVKEIQLASFCSNRDIPETVPGTML